MIKGLFFWISFCFGSLWAQDVLKFEDRVYLDHIKSVKFHHSGLYTSVPIIDMASRGQLILSFDDTYGGDRDYRYKIIHCDKDWNPSDLDEMDYLDGFNDEDIENYAYSIGTKLNYTHYRLTLPNSDVAWRISGNYLLVVHDDESDELAISRRFMVVESEVSVLGEIRRPVSALLGSTHHEVDFTINHKNFNISSPQREVFVTILQNGRWDNHITNIQPRIITGYNMDFRNTEHINFSGTNEFRGADLRSTRNAGFGVHTIEVYPDGYEVLLHLDKKRNQWSDFDFEDLNGSYIIENLDDRGSSINEISSHDLKSEYMNVHFTLESRDVLLDKDVFVVGGFTDWKCLESLRMDYNYKNQVYTASTLLKQGYYDYQYVVVDKNESDFEYFEGSHFATFNEYKILVYLRSFSDRHDRLIGVGNLKSDF